MENSQKIIEKIRSDKIKPIPKYRFMLKAIMIWSGFSLFILVGAIAFSIILYSIQQNSFDLLNHISHSTLEFFLALIPLVWLITLLLFLAASMWTIRYSKRGYKIGQGKWLAYSTAVSIALGTLFFISGGANWVENSFANKIELYESVEERKINIWNNPDEGNLAGMILTIEKDILNIRDFNQMEWSIDISSAFIAHMVVLEPGEKIKIIGTRTAEHAFKAQEIRPWGGKKYRSGGKNERKNKGMRNRG
jgi:hypothetical protein